MSSFYLQNWFIAAALASSLLSSCRTPSEQGQTPDKPAQRSWPAAMTELSVTLARLLPLTSPSSRLDENGRKELLVNAEKMELLAREINHSNSRPDEDPSLRYFTRLFEDDMSRAHQALQMGQTDYARQVLRGATSYCISCHSRSSEGPEFSSLDINKYVDRLSPFQKAEFFAATRQFSRAASEFGQVLKSESVAKQSPFDWEQAARFALALNVRVQQNPQAAQETLDLVTSANYAPQFLKQEARQWKKSVSQWRKEKSKSLKRSSAQLVQAKRLIKKAKSKQKYPLDRAGDIEYLRATSHLHDILRSPLDDRREIYEEALYLAGVASAAVRDVSFWNLHETYFDVCIRYAPHSKTARKCFDQLQASTLAGFSGSSGTSVPADVQKRLTELKALSQPARP